MEDTMRAFAALATVFLIAGAAAAQPKAPPVSPVPPQAPPTATTDYPPKVLFCRVQERSVKDAITLRDDNWYPQPYIVVYPQGYGKGVWLSAGASNDDIAAAIEGRQAVPRPNPFQPAAAPPVQPEAPLVDDASLALLVPKEARAYSLTPLYQQMYTMNGGRSRFNVKRGMDSDWPEEYKVSGGMRGLTGWKSDKRILLPKDTKVEVWTVDEDVRAFSLVPRVRWRFPDGTVTYDILSTDRGVYEVRSRTRDGGEWFTKVLGRDASAAPQGYHGAGKACSSCHDYAGGLSDTSSIYRHGIWGSDTVFSWRPFNEDGSYDYSWPIEVR